MCVCEYIYVYICIYTSIYIHFLCLTSECSETLRPIRSLKRTVTPADTGYLVGLSRIGDDETACKAHCLSDNNCVGVLMDFTKERHDLTKCVGFATQATHGQVVSDPCCTYYVKEACVKPKAISRERLLSKLKNVNWVPRPQPQRPNPSSSLSVSIAGLLPVARPPPPPVAPKLPPWLLAGRGAAVDSSSQVVRSRGNSFIPPPRPPPPPPAPPAPAPQPQPAARPVYRPPPSPSAKTRPCPRQPTRVSI